MNRLVVEEKLRAFFIEDQGDGDLSGRVFEKEHESEAVVRAKEPGIAAGLELFNIGFGLLDPHVRVELFCQDGEHFEAGDALVKLSGPTTSILSGERVLLNLVQRMSSIATMTNACCRLVEGTGTQIVDTRKTTAGLRIFEKYAVRVGGGMNHRNGLYDAVMLKDNHIAACGSIKVAVEIVRAKVGPTVKVEVEIESKEQLLEAIEARPDIIMFDNQLPATIREWKSIVPQGILVEVSGGITLDTLSDYAYAGADIISLGALTHSVKPIDLSLNVTTSPKEVHV